MVDTTDTVFDETNYEQFCRERRAAIMERVQSAATSAGRATDELLVEAVSKTVDTAHVAAAHRAGWEVFAENRPQELERKHRAIAEDYPELQGVRFDMIGNLQKNKINHVLGLARLIQSVSSAELARGIAQRAQVHGIDQPVLLEVNVCGEASKSGFAPAELKQSFPELAQLEGIRIQGLMTMAPAGDKDAARRAFSGLRELRDELEVATGSQLPELSCGMSDDFPIAVEEGATILRLGRVVFSPEYELD